MSQPTSPDPRQQPGADPWHPGPSFGPSPVQPPTPPPAPQPGAQPSGLYGHLPQPYSQQHQYPPTPSSHGQYGQYGHGLYGWSGAQAPRKEPLLGLVTSFFIPGLGSMLNGDVGRGVGILIGYFVALLLSVILIGIPIALALWVWGMVDGYQGAVNKNRQNGYPN